MRDRGGWMGDYLTKLRAMPDYLWPEEPEPVAPGPAKPTPKPVEKVDLPGANIIGAMADADLFATGQAHIVLVDEAVARMGVHGIVFGRCAVEAVARYSAMPKAERKKVGTQAQFLTKGFGRRLTTVNRWLRAARCYDDPDVVWGDVEELCREQNFNPEAWGADLVVAKWKWFIEQKGGKKPSGGPPVEPEASEPEPAPAQAAPRRRGGIPMHEAPMTAEEQHVYGFTPENHSPISLRDLCRSLGYRAGV